MQQSCFCLPDIFMASDMMVAASFLPSLSDFLYLTFYTKSSKSLFFPFKEVKT